MRRSPPPKRRTPMPRSGRVRPRNPERRDEKHARNFGDEAERVRSMACVAARPSAWQTTISQDVWWLLDGRTECSGDNVVMHVESRGSCGGRLDTVCACSHHHDEQHLNGIKSFAARYGLDLRKLADDAALEHPRPLGIRGLADRWAGGPWTCRSCSSVLVGDNIGGCVCLDCGEPLAEEPDAGPLDTYERDALLGWVRREMAREVERRRSMFLVGSPPSLEEIGERRRHAFDREALAHHVAQLLGGPFTEDPHGEHGLAWSFCEAAGWPS